MSADHWADTLTRNIPVCIGVGEAAGTAAALAIKEKCSVRALDIAKLQDYLESHGLKTGRRPVPVAVGK